MRRKILRYYALFEVFECSRFRLRHIGSDQQAATEDLAVRSLPLEYRAQAPHITSVALWTDADVKVLEVSIRFCRKVLEVDKHRKSQGLLEDAHAIE